MCKLDELLSRQTAANEGTIIYYQSTISIRLHVCLIARREKHMKISRYTRGTWQNLLIQRHF